ncbi:MAG: hypothetical protein J6M06_00995 [Synergistaceae bacterium]|nr:hypothetical protein [Synergistaceae bacterium]
MKIKITSELKVPAEVRPLIGQVYETVEPDYIPPLMSDAYFIRVGAYQTQIGVLPGECVIVEE